MMTEPYPEQAARFQSWQLRVHLILVMFVTADSSSIIERRWKACQQLCNTRRKLQHRGRGKDRRRHKEGHVCFGTVLPQYPSDRRDAKQLVQNEWRRRF